MGSDLRAEIKQRAPFPSREEEAFVSLLRTTAVLEHAMECYFKQNGLTLTQYNALRILRGAGPEGLCRHEVSDRMIKPVGDTTRLLDRMASAGWVERVREQSDRRFVTARITNDGLEKLGTLDADVTRFTRERLGHLSEREVEQLIGLLGRAREEP